MFILYHRKNETEEVVLAPSLSPSSSIKSQEKSDPIILPKYCCCCQFILNKIKKYPFLLFIPLIKISIVATVGHAVFQKLRSKNSNNKAPPNVSEMFDLHTKSIKQLCHYGNNRNCTCGHPVNKKRAKWYDAHEQRKKEVLENANKELDVVFLGDSITESWSGKWIIFDYDTSDVHEVFIRHFSKTGNDFENIDTNKNHLQGLALGIAADKCSDLLYRIQNGELDLNSKIFWVLIGTNDIRNNCSIESVVFKILQIVQEITRQKPNAKIVLNGILPRTYPNSKDGTLGDFWPLIQDINKQLKKYCQRYDQLYYFDASDLFLEKNDENQYYIPKELMPDFLHPSAEGHELWANAIVSFIHSHHLI